LISRAHAETHTVTDGMGTNIPDTDIGGATGGGETGLSPGTDTGDRVTGGSDTTRVTSPESTPESVPESTGSTTTTAETTGVQTTPRQTTAAQTTQSPADTGDSGGWIIAVIIVALIAAVIIAVIAFMPKRNDM